jgi:nitroreductase
MKNTYKLILKRRTIRKFFQKKIKNSDLLLFVNAARLAPSSANLQPLEYILVAKNIEKVFECTSWAGYLKDGAPKKGEEPTAYILVMANTKISINAKYDVGLAIENILLTALEKGVAGCIIGSLNREKLVANFNIPKDYTVELAVALGYPKQKSVEDKFIADKKYWLDEKSVLHVPKRKLKDIIHKEIF